MKRYIKIMKINKENKVGTKRQEIQEGMNIPSWISCLFLEY
jgi:hypothetical protein